MNQFIKARQKEINYQDALCDQGIMCLLINTDVKEIDVITGVEEPGLIELNLPTKHVLSILNEKFSAWEILRKTQVQQQVLEIKEGREVIFQGQWVTFVARKRHSE